MINSESEIAPAGEITTETTGPSAAEGPTSHGLTIRTSEAEVTPVAEAPINHLVTLKERLEVLIITVKALGLSDFPGFTTMSQMNLFAIIRSIRFLLGTLQT